MLLVLTTLQSRCNLLTGETNIEVDGLTIVAPSVGNLRPGADDHLDVTVLLTDSRYEGFTRVTNTTTVHYCGDLTFLTMALLLASLASDGQKEEPSWRNNTPRWARTGAKMGPASLTRARGPFPKEDKFNPEKLGDTTPGIGASRSDFSSNIPRWIRQGLERPDWLAGPDGHYRPQDDLISSLDDLFPGGMRYDGTVPPYIQSLLRRSS